MTKDEADISKPLAASSKLSIKLAIFGSDTENIFSGAWPDRGNFVNYLDAELRKLTPKSWSSRCAGNSTGSIVVEDLLSIIRILKHDRALTRSQIRCQFRSSLASGNEVDPDVALDVAACLVTMLNVRNVRFKLHTPQTPTIQWDDSSTLDAVVARQLPVTSWSISSREGRLHPAFTVAAMARICGLKVAWTACLADHLRLDRTSKLLRVFPYKQSLLDHLENSIRHDQPSFIPNTVLAETIQSLDLLFPHWDFPTNELLKEHGQSFHQIGPFSSSRPLNLCTFEHWRDRLAELYEEVYCCPPASWAQLWADRRSPQQWYTFWIALLILVLTVITTIASVVQAWASIKSLH